MRTARHAGEQESAIELRHQLLLEEKRGECRRGFHRRARPGAAPARSPHRRGRGHTRRELGEEAAIAQPGEAGRRGKGPAWCCRRYQQQQPIAVGEGRVIDLEVISHDGLQQAAEGLIALENGRNGVTGLVGVLRLQASGRQFGLQRLAGCVQYLVGDEIRVVVTLADALARIWER